MLEGSARWQAQVEVQLEGIPEKARVMQLRRSWWCTPVEAQERRVLEVLEEGGGNLVRRAQPNSWKLDPHGAHGELGAALHEVAQEIEGRGDGVGCAQEDSPANEA